MWTDTEYLLALVVDGINGTNYLLRAAPHFKHPPKKPPKPLWRPGDGAAVDPKAALARYEELKAQIAGATAVAAARNVEEVTTVWQRN